MGKSKSKTSSSSKFQRNSSATPYAPIAGGLSQLGQNIGQAMNEVQALPGYTGPMVATGGQYQQAVLPAMQQSSQFAHSLTPMAMQAAQRMMDNTPTFEGPSLSAGTQSLAQSNPGGLEGAINAAIQPYMRQLTEQVLPGMQSSAMEAGAYGSDRAMNVLPGQAIRDTSRMVAEAAGGLTMQDFQSQQERALQAYGLGTQRGLGTSQQVAQNMAMYPELLNSAMGFNAMGTDYTQQAANYDIAMRQAEINNAIAMDQQAAALPFRGLDQAASLYGTFAPYASQYQSGKESSKSTTTQSQPLGQQLLQGALGIGSALMGMPGGLGGLFGGAAAATAANPLIGAGMSMAGSMMQQPSQISGSFLGPNWRPY